MPTELVTVEIIQVHIDITIKQMEKRQYKHSSGKLATMWGYTIEDEKVYYQVDNEPHLIPIWMVEQSKDWELIIPQVEPVWVVERISRGNDMDCILKANDQYVWHNKPDKFGGCTLQHLLEEGNTIHSVRADKQSPVIAIGDYITAECTHMGNTPMQVEGFTINDKNNLLIKTRQFRTHGVSIENCRKVDAPVEKKPLFVTEDDVPAYSDTPVWGVNVIHWNTIDHDTADKLDHTIWKWFSTEQARDQYIASKKQKPAVQPEQEQIAKVGEYVIGEKKQLSRQGMQGV